MMPGVFRSWWQVVRVILYAAAFDAALWVLCS